MAKKKTRKTNKPGFSSIIALSVVIGLSVIVGGGMYFFTTIEGIEDRSIVPVTVDSRSNTNKGYNTFEVNPLDYWETYTNEEYGFGLSFPQDWEVVELDGAQIIAQLKPKKETYFFEGSEAYPIYITVEEGSTEQYIKDVYDNKATEITHGTVDYSIVSAEADNVSSMSYFTDVGIYRLGITNDITDIVIANGLTEEEEDELQDVLDGILSSVTLNNTSNSMDTSDWETYTNEEYGYSIQYPTDWVSSELISTKHVQVIPTGYEPGTSGGTARALTIKKVENIGEGGIVVDGPETVEIDGISVVKQTEVGIVDILVSYYPVDDGGYIQLYWGKSLNDNYPEYEQILSTFQFTTDTSDWLTYMNNAHGYTFQYPPEYDIIEMSTNEDVYFVYKEGKSVLDIHYRLETIDGSLSTWFDHASSGDITMGGRIGKKYTYQPSDAGQTGSKTIAYVVQHQGKLLGLEFLGDYEMSVIENQILSTFQFTE
ncbi:hypothetical protein KKG41_03425 [Patescibacteria group bacterium]|nr:hypothetical protein [Patescibacteria group bacterium]MBU1890124.1 hypothetical protein [Patescibacteria group bacterium]